MNFLDPNDENFYYGSVTNKLEGNIMKTSDILKEVNLERDKQDQKWGEQNHDGFKWLAILGEEVGECNKAFLEGDLKNFREELIQVAAVAVAIIESIDRAEQSSIKSEYKNGDIVRYSNGSTALMRLLISPEDKPYEDPTFGRRLYGVQFYGGMTGAYESDLTPATPEEVSFFNKEGSRRGK